MFRPGLNSIGSFFKFATTGKISELPKTHPAAAQTNQKRWAEVSGWCSKSALAALGIGLVGAHQIASGKPLPGLLLLPVGVCTLFHLIKRALVADDKRLDWQRQMPPGKKV